MKKSEWDARTLEAVGAVEGELRRDSDGHHLELEASLASVDMMLHGTDLTVEYDNTTRSLGDDSDEVAGQVSLTAQLCPGWQAKLSLSGVGTCLWRRSR